MKVKLSEVCNITMGQSPDSSSYNQKSDGIPFFQGNADFGILYPTVRIWTTSPKKIAKKDDILISVRAPIGALNYANIECCIGRGLASITPSKKVHSKYVFYLLKSKKNNLDSQGIGSTFKAIGRKNLEEIEIENLDIEYQIKISSYLDSIQSAIDNKQQQLKELDELVKSRFIEMFGDFDLYPQEKDWTPLKEISKVFTGTTPSTTDERNWNGDILWITPAEITSESFYIYKTERKITEKGRKSKSLDIMPEGTVLLSTRAPIGKVGIVGTPMTCNQGFKNFYCDEKKINPIFLYEILKYNTVFLNSKGTGTTFKELSKSNAEQIKIPVPPLELQNQFATFVQQIDKSKFVSEQFMDSCYNMIR